MKPNRLILLVWLLIAFTQQAMAQCAGMSFTADITNGCAPATIKFTSTGVQPGCEFAWNFGSGYSAYSTADSIKFNLFPSSGTYTVRMKVKIPGNPNPCTIIKSNYITISSGNSINVYVSNSLVCAPGDSITLIDSSTGVTSRDWYIEGGKISNGPQTLRYAFATSGAKTISLKATTSSGCIASLLMDSAVVVYSGIKVQKFTTTNNYDCPPVSSTYTALYSLPQQKLTTFSWSFPGGTPSQSNVGGPSIAYSKPGVYSATLTVNTDKGCKYIVKKDTAVTMLVPPKLNVSFSKSSVCNTEKVQIIASPTPVSFAGGKFSWSFNPTSASITDSTENGDSIKVIFTQEGVYYAHPVYTVMSCVADSVINFPITDHVAQAKYNSSASVFCTWPNDTVNFINTSITPSPPATYRFKWVFYDTAKKVIDTSNLLNPTRIYNDTGNFKVSLFIVSSDGCVDSVVNDPYVVIGNPKAKFDVKPKKICIGDKAQFKNVTPAFSTGHSAKVKWIFYGADHATVLKTDSTGSPEMAYADTGTYGLKFIVYNDLGCADTLIDSFAVQVFNIKANFKQDKTKICPGDPVKFTATTLPALDKLEHKWVLIPHDTSLNMKFPGGGNIYAPSIPYPGVYDMLLISNTPSCVDTFRLNDALIINGVDVKLKVDSSISGCVPGSGKAEAILLSNFHDGFIDTTVTWKWSTMASVVSIVSPTSDTTSLYYGQSGCGQHDLVLEAKNSAGCTNTFNTSIAYCLGNKAAFEISSVWPCVGDSIGIQNKSENAYKFKWVATPANVTFVPSDTSETPYLIVNDTGDVVLKLYTYALSGCKDSISKFLLPKRPEFDFFTNDTIGYCGPFSVDLKIKNNLNSIAFDWDFGDGSALVSTDSPYISHLYDIENGLSRFKVSVTGYDKYSCRRTISKPNMVRIIGPVPKFSILHGTGCEPLNVDFVDSTIDASELYFFTDKGSIDTQYIKTPSVYTLKNFNDSFSVYKPFMIAKDTTGCTKAYTSPDSILVFRQPRASFTVDDTVACVGQPFNFKDLSSFAVKWEWDFNNDGIIDDSVKDPVYIYTKRGDYKVKLKVYNSGGCFDSIEMADVIKIRNKPRASFYLNDSVYCFTQTITFHDSSDFDATSYQKYLWDFGDPLVFDDTSTLIHPKFNYKHAGLFDITLTVADETGCLSTLTKNSALRILDSVTPFPERLIKVDLYNDSQLIVAWKRNPSNRFLWYSLYQVDSPNNVLAFQSANPDDTTFIIDKNIDVNKAYEDFYIISEEVCNSYITPKHRSIHLSADTVGMFTNLITWNQYIGFDSIKEYLLYRTTDTAKGFKLYKVLNATDSVYVDYPLCDSVYHYYVKAVSIDSSLTSTSNKAESRPVYFNPISPVYLRTVTVTPEERIWVQWDTGGISPTTRFYELYKMKDQTSFVNYGKIEDDHFLDDRVNVNASIYTYKLTRTDHCFNTSPESNIGKNILLKAYNNNDTTYLNWSNYGNWVTGIQDYQLDLFNATQNGFGLLTNTFSDTFYIDQEVHNFDDSAFCYRVLATSNEGDLSYSNTACVTMGARLFIPNSFTPNKDRLNDVFKPSISFVHNGNANANVRYEFSIYNRWGELVFHTNNPHDGWDGTFKGVQSEQDFYIYAITAVSYQDKIDLSRRGVFLLLH